MLEEAEDEEKESPKKILNQYCLLQSIGRGSFGRVSRAVDQSTGKIYAIKECSMALLKKRNQLKLLKLARQRQRQHGFMSNASSNSVHSVPSTANDNGISSSPLWPNNIPEEVKVEIAILKKVQHPNVVQLVEVLETADQDVLYMVFEYCAEGVLMQLHPTETIPAFSEELSKYYFGQLVSGIAYLHEHGICHRDIKPDNLLLASKGVLKIADFGVSSMFDKENDGVSQSVGSPAFMSPELRCAGRSKSISGRAADIWAMGITLFCMTHGQVPMSGTPGQSWISFGEHISQELKDFLMGLLEKDPSIRFSMCALRQHAWMRSSDVDTIFKHDSSLMRPSCEDIHQAITPCSSIFTVLKAVSKLKKSLQ